MVIYCKHKYTLLKYPFTLTINSNSDNTAFRVCADKIEKLHADGSRPC